MYSGYLDEAVELTVDGAKIVVTVVLLLYCFYIASILLLDVKNTSHFLHGWIHLAMMY